MEGIQFIVDEKGKKKAVIIDLEKYGELWEDFYDSITYRLRVHEPRETFETVKDKLRKQGKLDG